jgi:hypothetical protein
MQYQTGEYSEHALKITAIIVDATKEEELASKGR